MLGNSVLQFLVAQHRNTANDVCRQGGNLRLCIIRIQPKLGPSCWGTYSALRQVCRADEGGRELEERGQPAGIESPVINLSPGVSMRVPPHTTSQAPQSAASKKEAAGCIFNCSAERKLCCICSMKAL